MALGLVAGGAASLWMLAGPTSFGLSWLIGVGLIKLTVVSSLGLIAGGAMVQRFAKRNEEKRRLTRAGVSSKDTD